MIKEKRRLINQPNGCATSRIDNPYLEQLFFSFFRLLVGGAVDSGCSNDQKREVLDSEENEE